MLKFVDLSGSCCQSVESPRHQGSLSSSQGLSTDWCSHNEIIKNKFVHSKSTDQGYSAHLQNTLTASPILVLGWARASHNAQNTIMIINCKILVNQRCNLEFSSNYNLYRKTVPFSANNYPLKTFISFVIPSKAQHSCCYYISSMEFCFERSFILHCNNANGGENARIWK